MNYSLSNIVTFFLFIAGLFYLILINYSFDYISFSGKFYLFISYILCSSVILFYLIKRKALDYIPILPLVCFYFIVCYLTGSFSGFNIFINHTIVNVSDLKFALQILTLGIFFLIFGYFSFYKIFGKLKRKEFEILNFSKVEIFYFGLILNLSTVIFFYIIEIQNLLTFTSQIKYVFLFLSFGTFTSYLFHSNYVFEKKNFIIISFKILLIFLEILEGSYALPFIMIFLDYVYYSFLKKKFNLIPVIILCFTFLFIHEGKYQFRNLTWNVYNYDRNQSILEGSKIFFNLYKHNLKNNFDIKNFFDVKNQTYRRINHSFESLVIVSSKSPNEINFWDGYSYKILASKLIPRVFWSEKPNDTLGNAFAHRYQIIDEKDFHTSWNMPVLNEFYVNFGTRGVIIGMFGMGFLFGFFANFFSFKDSRNVEGIISFYFFIPLFFLESHLSLLLGAVIQSYILSFIISVLFVLFFRRLKLNLYLN